MRGRGYGRISRSANHSAEPSFNIAKEIFGPALVLIPYTDFSEWNRSL